MCLDCHGCHLSMTLSILCVVYHYIFTVGPKYPLIENHQKSTNPNK